MGAQIEVYNNGLRTGRTNIAFGATITKEIMRGYELDFSVVNIDPIRPYIMPGATFKADGQLFDIVKYTQNSGRINCTSVIANHVSCRTNNYTVPADYSFVGTPAAIISDFLTQSGCAEFSLGTSEYTGTISFSLGNTQAVTLRAALWALGQAGMGFEIDYDNFTINAPLRIGADKGKVFQFGKDLCDLTRDWNGMDSTPTTTYTVDVAVLWRVAGSNAISFSVGDTVQITDAMIGDTITGKRICIYKKCLDDPTQDEVTIGDFIPDAADTFIAQQVAINNSVQQGESYNNNRITRKEGLVSETDDGMLRTIMSGTGGFRIQLNKDSDWMDLFYVDSSDGKITIQSAEESGTRVELGAQSGLAVYKNYWLVAGLDTDGNSVATKFYRPGYPNQYGIIGSTPEGYIGLELYDGDTCFARLYEQDGGGLGIYDGSMTSKIQLDATNGTQFFKSNSLTNSSQTLSFYSQDGKRITIDTYNGFVQSMSIQ